MKWSKCDGPVLIASDGVSSLNFIIDLWSYFNHYLIFQTDNWSLEGLRNWPKVSLLMAADFEHKAILLPIVQYRLFVVPTVCRQGWVHSSVQVPWRQKVHGMNYHLAEWH